MEEKGMDKPVTDTPDWHKPSNDGCPQNEDIYAECKCDRWAFKRRAVRRVRSKWEIRVVDQSVDHGIKERLALEIHADGKMIIRESGRRAAYETTLGQVYGRLVRSHAVAQAFAAKKARGEKRKAAKQSKRLAERMSRQTKRAA